MMRKKGRTIEAYKKLGAMMRLYKTIGDKMLYCAETVLSASDQDIILRAMRKIDLMCTRAEDNMFRDYPNLPNEYLGVFFGSTASEATNDVDREIIGIAREEAGKLFGENNV